ncbi:MAG: efflux transporter outer membrane subunit [Deltaproteobacteria bacterium]|jgi:multidrug efflux system outer membrane protein|nr:efflux transporter outer membrane subunit [Deltaproteobacteria bacterium]
MSGYRFVAPALLLVLGGCAAGPDYERPELEVPEKYIQPVQQGESFANTPWWELFEDPQLQELIRIALEENQDLGIAAARVEEFRAVLGVTRADQFPTVDITASGAQTEGSDNVFPGSVPGFGNDKVENYRLSADVFWELDLFGRLRRSTEAARAQLLATEEAQRSITISLVASVASSYMLLRDLDAQLEIARRTESTRTDSLGIIQARFDKGTVPKLDVNQAEIELAVASAAVAAAERAVTQTENALAVLLGRNPGAIPRGLALEQQTLPPGIPSGLPSELLQRRPDVLASEAELAAQTARIGVAQAARWPSLSLTGALGFESDDLSTLTDSGSDFWSAGLGIVQPLFNAGRNRSRVEAEEARTEQALLAYEQTVQRAFREVEDALVAVRTYRAEHEARRRQVAAARSAATLSRARYDGGVSSYLEVLDTERSLFNAELTESQTLRLYINAIIELYKALGGGWNPESDE